MIHYLDRELARLQDYDGLCCLLVNGWLVRFQVREVKPSPSRPAGIKYSFTLHDVDLVRLLGFDNAHGLPKMLAYDHRHGFRTGRKPVPYDYRDGDGLVADFFEAVEAACRREGVAFEFVDKWYEIDAPGEDDEAEEDHPDR